MIALSVLLALSISAGVIITSKEELFRWIYRKIATLISKLEEWTAILRDDEPFDASWMDADKWRKSR